MGEGVVDAGDVDRDDIVKKNRTKRSPSFFMLFSFMRRGREILLSVTQGRHCCGCGGSDKRQWIAGLGRGVNSHRCALLVIWGQFCFMSDGSPPDG